VIRIEHLPADVVELSPLAREALSGKLHVPGFVVARRVEDVPRLAERFEPSERANLARVLESNLARLSPHVAVLDAVRSLAEPGASVVVTGQQPGFLVSPLYSLYKALQALRLAQILRERWSAPVIAIFWNHADDHDVAEVHHSYLVNANLDLQKVALAGLSSGRLPLSRIVFDDEAQRLPAIESLLRELVQGEPHAARAIDVLLPRRGETFARAFTRSMTELLGPLGLVVLEPDWIREPMSAALARIVESDPAAKLASGAQSVRASGHEVAIDPEGAALVYHHASDGGPSSGGTYGTRTALRTGGDGFRYDGENGSRTSAELAAEIVQAPLEWSPGALLRPIVQDVCLPAAAYIGGFGELAYHAELVPLRDGLGVPRTPFVPRISCTLCDPECRVALTKLGRDAAGVLRSRGVFRAESPAEESPAVIADMRDIAARAAQELAKLRDALSELDPSLVVQIKRTADQMRSAVDKLAEKAERVHQNKTGKGKRHERRLANALYPRSLPQERVLGPIQFVARFGEDWIQELAREIDPFGSEHLIVQLGVETDVEGAA
jgi:bacillithiol biosynthesis cysteine-adding enzyme BshC